MCVRLILLTMSPLLSPYPDIPHHGLLPLACPRLSPMLSRMIFRMLSPLFVPRISLSIFPLPVAIMVLMDLSVS